MSLDSLSMILVARLNEMREKGISKGPEHIISGTKPAADGSGPRCYLEGYGNREFLRMNSNSYLGLSLHPEVIAAEEKAAREFGTGPGAVRFISGTYGPHVQLESRLAEFHGRQAAMIFNAAYAAIMGVLPQLITDKTIVLSDTLNHNCIINGVRLARPARKYVYRHLDMTDLEAKLHACIGNAKRLLVVSDGIFSMRGDFVPLHELTAICHQYEEHFAEGIVTIIDDSHGIGAFGQSGRGVEEFTGSRADILVATLGKALGVNGGYVVADKSVIDYLRETAQFYVYSNPITPSEAAAASQALALLDGPVGQEMLVRLRSLTRRFEVGLLQMSLEIIEGEHPIVPLMIRDTEKTTALVQYLFEHGILATGLNYPVVPEGDQEIRFQVSASHTEQDIDFVLNVLDGFSDYLHNSL
ncbi:MAG: aminotransferase class I/II-fold pyridoxal phosphate-dependent enzyme [Desulfobulbaceae bacterium]|nr:aminotransferase class I/II-fold pyridoxal phosphate-dependent enzyme [Desulfobulbaceae bacterium]